jgi:SAM-dependent methyltransferase
MDTPWTRSETVRGFCAAPPNERLLRFAAQELSRRGGVGCALDIGCGAGRNAIPLAQNGWEVFGVDTSWPMLEAVTCAAQDASIDRLRLVAASMDRLPSASERFDLVIAHGVWNLAQSDEEFRRAIAEGARVLKPGGALFAFTFSRQTLPSAASPLAGNRFTYTHFSGTAQCFVTERELLEELEDVGLTPDPALPLVEYNRPADRHLAVHGRPAIHEGGFRRIAR